MKVCFPAPLYCGFGEDPASQKQKETISEINRLIDKMVKSKNLGISVAGKITNGMERDTITYNGIPDFVEVVTGEKIQKLRLITAHGQRILKEGKVQASSTPLEIKNDSHHHFYNDLKGLFLYRPKKTKNFLFQRIGPHGYLDIEIPENMKVLKIDLRERYHIDQEYYLLPGKSSLPDWIEKAYLKFERTGEAPDYLKEKLKAIHDDGGLEARQYYLNFLDPRKADPLPIPSSFEGGTTDVDGLRFVPLKLREEFVGEQYSREEQKKRGLNAALSNVSYLRTAAARKQYKVFIRNGLFYNSRGHLLNSAEQDRPSIMIFALDPFKGGPGLYAMMSYNRLRQRHSSFLDGRPILMGVEAIFDQGKLIYINDGTGHYFHEAIYENFDQFLIWLHRQNVSFDGTIVGSYKDNDIGDKIKSTNFSNFTDVLERELIKVRTLQ